jgi:hypothetical protein
MSEIVFQVLAESAWALAQPRSVMAVIRRFNMRFIELSKGLGVKFKKIRNAIPLLYTKLF